LFGKSERKRPLERPRPRCEDNIDTDHKAIGWEGVEWINLVQDRDMSLAVLKTVMNLLI
jgi:hypothetical protein